MRAEEFPMRQFLKNLFRDLRTTKTTTRPIRRAACTSLRLEGLEDRTVLSTAGLSTATGILDVVVSPNSSVSLLEVTTGGTRQIAVLGATAQGTSDPAQFPINSFKSVEITVTGQDTVNIDDSFGMPFNPNTTITLNGNETDSTLSLFGSRLVGGNESYFAQDEDGDGAIKLDNLEFDFNRAFATVTDSIPTNGIYAVSTSGQTIDLSGPRPRSTSRTNSFGGLAVNGGGLLTYANKPTVALNEYATAATITLDALKSAAGEKDSVVNMWGEYDSTTLVATPAGVLTSVASAAANQTEQLYGNGGPVVFSGTSSTTAVIGQPASGEEFSTHEIFANVSVVGPGYVQIADNANKSTSENVHVTESTVSGSGLFGNNSVKLVYNDVKFLTLMTGQDSDIYTVAASQAGAEFSAQINILDFSTVELRVGVTINDHNNLNLQLYNSNPNNGAAELFVHVPSTASLSGGENGTGSLGVTFPDGSASQILYENYGEVEVIG
jgi:hypothetical protein